MGRSPLTIAFRRFGRTEKTPVVFVQNFRATIDNYDPAITDALAEDREIILFDNRGIGATNGIGVPPSENLRHARVSTDLCVYRAPGRPGSLAFVNVVTGKPAALRRFGELLRLAGDRSQAIAGVGDVAYAIGANVFALRGDTLIVTGVGYAGFALGTAHSVDRARAQCCRQRDRDQLHARVGPYARHAAERMNRRESYAE